MTSRSSSLEGAVRRSERDGLQALRASAGAEEAAEALAPRAARVRCGAVVRALEDPSDGKVGTGADPQVLQGEASIDASEVRVRQAGDERTGRDARTIGGEQGEDARLLAGNANVGGRRVELPRRGQRV